mmetsp:Transcript_53167/g.108445  ORF Transcript_53167/g.108445 Transcript_53167/m.108445 type:complete len:828 (+) Transcript_53167:105-2588(+)
MSQSTLGSFFKKKVPEENAQPNPAQSKSDLKGAAKQGSPKKDISTKETPPTGRKRIRPAESDGEDSEPEMVQTKRPNHPETSDAAPSDVDMEKAEIKEVTNSKPLTEAKEDSASEDVKMEQEKDPSCDKKETVEKKAEPNTSSAPIRKAAAKPAAKAKNEDATTTAAKPSHKDDDGNSDEEAEEVDADQIATESIRSSSSFDAAKEGGWKKGEPVPYACLAAAFEKIEATTKRLEIASILTSALRCIIELTPNDLLPAVYLCVNKLAPAHEGIELGLGDMVLKKALAEATGRQAKDISAEYEKVGDLGIVATNSRSKQRTMFAAKPLSVRHVHNSLLLIAKMVGKDSGTQKKDKIKSLLVASKGIEAQYVVRHLQGKMRIGLAEQTVLVALAHAVALSPPVGKPPSRSNLKAELEKATEVLKEVFCQLPCYDKIVPHLLSKPIQDLGKHCFLVPGIPIKPMLAHPTKGISEVLDRFADQNFTCEYKYDGERGQVHLLEDGTVKIFSRNSEDNTSKYPDIIEMMPKVIKEGVTSFVLDAEVVAVDTQTKKILPFQVLSTRKRKDADQSEILVQVCLFAFDILYLNGEPLLKQNLQTRRAKLHESFNVKEGEFVFATSKDASDTEEILAFLNEAVNASCEGLMVKTLDNDAATYEPDKRSHKWLKVKKDYINGMTDSLDLVPIGAFWGKGKRVGTYGAYLLACYNDETEDFETICKIGTGFKDEELKEFTEFFKPHACDAPKSYYQWEDTPKDKPDVWFEPKVVWEVAAADLSISPVHKAAIGMVDDAKGIALRFPRLVRVRDDKTPENATNSTQVAEMYRKQAVVADD